MLDDARPNYGKKLSYCSLNRTCVSVHRVFTRLCTALSWRPMRTGVTAAIVTISAAGGGAGDGTADNGGVVGNDYNNDLEGVKQFTSAEQTED